MLQDIIPPHGFLAKPSVLWPIDPVGKDRVVQTTSNAPPAPGHADTLRPTAERLQEDEPRLKEGGGPPEEEEEVKPQEEMQAEVNPDREGHSNGNGNANGSVNGVSVKEKATASPTLKSWETFSNHGSVPDLEDIDFWQPKPPKVLMDDPKDIPLELRSQIQVYAATE